MTPLAPVSLFMATVNTWQRLHLCGPCALLPFKFTQKPISLLSCLVSKNICRLILLEWVILFKKPTVMALIGNYVNRVNVIKGSLYSRLYGKAE